MCARLIHGGLFGEMRGALGGVVFTKNAGGEVVRRRSVVVNRNTPAQQNVRALFAAGSQQYSQLTAAQRATWESPGLGMPLTGSKPPMLDPGSPLVKTGGGQPMGAPAATLDGTIGKNVFMQYWVWSGRLAQNAAIPVGTPAPIAYASSLTRPTTVISSSNINGIATSIADLAISPAGLEVTIVGIGGILTNSIQGAVPCGIAVYASNPLPFIGARANKRPNFLIGSVEPQNIAADSDALVYTLSNTGFDPVQSARPLQTGQIREFFVYLTDSWGTHKLIGREQMPVG